MATRSSDLGAAGEEAACGHLVSAGVQILARNWRWSRGEVDIVARDGDTLVFYEVRTRSGRRCGTPLESVTPAKLNRMAETAAAWLTRFGPYSGPVRLDVLAVTPRRGGWQVAHLSGVGQ